MIIWCKCDKWAVACNCCKQFMCVYCRQQVKNKKKRGKKKKEQQENI